MTEFALGRAPAPVGLATALTDSKNRSSQNLQEISKDGENLQANSGEFKA